MLAASKNSLITALKAQETIKNIYENDLKDSDKIYNENSDKTLPKVNFTEEYLGYTTTGLIAQYAATNNNGTATSVSNRTSTTTWKDISGSSITYNGTISGATWGTDRNGIQCLKFDGTNDFVNLGQINNTSGTIEIATSLEEIKETPRSIIANTEGAGVAIQIRKKTDSQGIECGYLYTYTYDMANSSYQSIEGGTIYPNQIYYMALIFESYGNIKLYINGELIGTLVMSGAVKISECPITMGADPAAGGGKSEYYNGNVYSARIYDIPLTEEEIKQNYRTDRYNIEGLLLNAKALDNESGISKYIFKEGTGSTVNYDDTSLIAIPEKTKEIDLQYKLTGTLPTTGIKKYSVYVFDGNKNGGKDDSYDEINVESSYKNGYQANIYKTTKQEQINVDRDVYIKSNGLLAMYDAEQNNGVGSYSSSTTTWKDISGTSTTYNGTIKNSASWTTVNGKKALYLNNDGISNMNYAKWVDLGKINSSYGTWEITFLTPKAMSNTMSFLANYEAGGLGIYSKYSNNTHNIVVEAYIDDGYKTIGQKTLEINKVYVMTMTYNGYELIGYCNGEEYCRISASGVIKTTTINTHMIIGGNPSGDKVVSEIFNGYIYGARIYNYALTAGQVKQNYEMDYNKYVK